MVDLNVKVASLHRIICHSIGSQWSCLRSASGVEEGETFPSVLFSIIFISAVE